MIRQGDHPKLPDRLHFLHHCSFSLTATFSLTASQFSLSSWRVEIRFIGPIPANTSPESFRNSGPVRGILAS